MDFVIFVLRSIVSNPFKFKIIADISMLYKFTIVKHICLKLNIHHDYNLLNHQKGAIGSLLHCMRDKLP